MPDKQVLKLIRHPELLGVTPGVLIYNNEIVCYTIELPWVDNGPFISCIPTGVYRLKYTHSPSFKKYTYELLSVPKRTGIRIHSANIVSQLSGCIAPCTCFKHVYNKAFGYNSSDAVKKVEGLITDQSIDSISVS